MLQSIDAMTGDADLARLAALGNLAAFERIYRTHYRRVFHVICRIVGGIEARAEELAQETFVRAWQSIKDFRAEAALSTWLHRMAVNTALMDLRSRRSGEDREVDDECLAERAEAPVRATCGWICRRPSISCRHEPARCWCCSIWRAGRTRKLARHWVWRWVVQRRSCIALGSC